MRLTMKVNKIKGLIILYGLVCAAEYYYFMNYQLSVEAVQDDGGMVYSTSEFIRIKNMIFEIAVQEFGMMGIAVSSAIVTAILYSLFLAGKWLFGLAFRRKRKQ